MAKPILIALLSFSFSVTWCQQNNLVFKKRGKAVHRYFTGSTIAFQLMDGEWKKGEITKIRNDSVYIRPVVVRYRLMGSDTAHYAVEGFALTDIFSLPNTGILIDYIDGRFQISRSGGHVHWYWIKSGVVFRIGAAVYAGLHIANGLIKNNLSIADSKIPLLTAAAVFTGGVLLHKHYKPYLRIGKKYRLEILNMGD